MNSRRPRFDSCGRGQTPLQFWARKNKRGRWHFVFITAKKSVRRVWSQCGQLMSYPIFESTFGFKPEGDICKSCINAMGDPRS